MKKYFKNLDELYNVGTNYFYQYNRYVDWIKITRDESGEPIILDKNTGRIIKGLKRINNFLKIKGYEIDC